MNMTFKLILIAIMLAGCTTVVTNDDAAGVREATDDQVRSCEFLRSISATSPFYGVFAGAAMNSLRGEIFRTAGDVGATHIVLSQHETTHGSTTAHAKAFKCKAMGTE